LLTVPCREVIKGKWIVPKDTRPSFAGQTVIVTGANVGLGLEASVKFVQLGADKVVLAVRTLSKGEEAKKEIERRTKRSGVLDVWHLDMMDYDSIKAFADRATRELERLDIACLNAGVAMIDFKQSQYGYERTLQVNLLSTALLALLLMPKLRASKTATFTPVLEIVGSSNHFLASSPGNFHK
jgi:NAD(P)-dependent dehydrogenase (short-subunit alcohol dehydrogenase family)